MSGPPLILASASPRRKMLLALTGASFKVRPTPVDETPRPGETPKDHVERLAREKAAWCAARAPQAWVLSADTVVVLGEEVMGKPVDEAQAAGMLGRLSGRVHEVFTGYCLTNQEFSEEAWASARTEVEFRLLTAYDIESYVLSREPLGKAGAYAIQGRGAGLIRRIDGSYTNVVGLPLAEVIELLRGRDLIP
jgi:septum formation protein